MNKKKLLAYLVAILFGAGIALSIIYFLTDDPLGKSVLIVIGAVPLFFIFHHYFAKILQKRGHKGK